jgi:hypothetical protein
MVKGDGFYCFGVNWNVCGNYFGKCVLAFFVLSKGMSKIFNY